MVDNTLFVSEIKRMYKDMKKEQFYNKLKEIDLDNLNNYQKAFILSFFDYLKRKYNYNLTTEAQKYKEFKLYRREYPKGVIIYTQKTHDISMRDFYIANSIEEFKNRNVLITNLEDSI